MADAPAQKRDKPRGRPFEKGNRANPGGRPKCAALVREALSGHADEMAERLLKLCRTEYGEDAKMAAVVERALEAYFDRIGVGPVPMKPEDKPAETSPLNGEAKISDADLTAALAPGQVN